MITTPTALADSTPEAMLIEAVRTGTAAFTLAVGRIERGQECTDTHATYRLVGEPIIQGPGTALALVRVVSGEQAGLDFTAHLQTT